MSFQFPSDIQQSISAFIANGIYQNEEEVLREAIGLLNQRQEDFASIQRGLDDIASGKFRSAEESNEEFRRIHNIPSAS
ncbi:MAG: hypothetical protein GXP24_12280 [Planctomycetes bacterium]|nr:hypothetical protein [Planctomycetota bacterium]